MGPVPTLTTRRTAQILEERARELSRLTQTLTLTSGSLIKRNQELDQFAYVISHDLKAPLRAIANLSQWIEEDLVDKLDETTQHQMNLMRGRVHRMEDLINGLLQYSRVGRAGMPPQMVEVAQLLAEVIDTLAPAPGFTVMVGPGMPVFLAEQLPLEQVFANLIGNALKYHHRKEGRVDISVAEQDDFYKFSVKDDGPGISPAFHEKIFVIFQTLQARDKVESTGIGLALVKKIVEGQGGRIWVESVLNQGATFNFTWPKAHS
ncbi:ATP-binding protein [Candidatus Cyanaurora vandensis]|uniref:sensor histidine kinase n=1 Tax=Candidatus Cyanaurora vandensis TaxID=2714958 RepID=UPI00257FC989|nr:ATP-binding protein [Candidatus Cyanaurora vandensis]